MLSEPTLFTSLCGAAFAALRLGSHPREHFCHCSFNLTSSRSECDALARIVLQQFAAKSARCPASGPASACDAGPGVLRILAEIFLGLLFLVIGFGVGVPWASRRRGARVVERDVPVSVATPATLGDGVVIRRLPTLESGGAPHKCRPLRARRLASAGLGRLPREYGVQVTPTPSSDWRWVGTMDRLKSGPQSGPGGLDGAQGDPVGARCAVPRGVRGQHLRLRSSRGAGAGVASSPRATTCHGDRLCWRHRERAGGRESG